MGASGTFGSILLVGRDSAESKQLVCCLRLLMLSLISRDEAAEAEKGVGPPCPQGREGSLLAALF